MRYRVIEGGYWRHGTLHIEREHLMSECFTSDAEGIELYREMTEWLIKGSDQGYYRKTFNARISWPEFFGVYPRKDGIIDFMVNEEGTMWFIPEENENYKKTVPGEGSQESWLHGELEEDNTENCIWFEELFPDGYTIPEFTIPANLSGRIYYSS